MKYRHNGGNWEPLKNSQVYINSDSDMKKVEQFTSEGKYEISYKNAFGHTYTQTVFVDKTNQPPLEAWRVDKEGKPMEKEAVSCTVDGMTYYGNYFYFLWENDENRLPWTAYYQSKTGDKWGTKFEYVADENGNMPIFNNEGIYKMTLSNGLKTYSFDFTLDKYIPDKNYQACTIL